MIMGLQTIIIQNFNCFSDGALPIIICFVGIFCVILEKISIFIGNKLKLWVIEEKDGSS
jgi:hypothetical protein